MSELPTWARDALAGIYDACCRDGYPQLTDQAKRKILGENLLRLHGLDVAEVRSRLGNRM